MCYNEFGGKMRKVILIDGNNLLFRSYYATAYKGNILRNSKGFPTNALYGFINMLNKIIHEEEPNYMMIAFDKGKTFRHEMYQDYKDGRKKMPIELNEQFPVAKMIAASMGIACFEIDNYEADDIIGTFAKEITNSSLYQGVIVSSDKDLLQLISDRVAVKLLKTNDYIWMDKPKFEEIYGLTPEKMIDIKALMGDSSDNIKGVKGIGEKTAITLLQTYGTLEGVYENIDKITGKTKEKLVLDRDSAFFSKKLATIYCDVPIDKDLEKIIYKGITKDYVPLLEKYEFFSILNKLDRNMLEKEPEEELTFKVLSSLDTVSKEEEFSIYLETAGSYHDKKVVGLALYNDKHSYFISGEDLKGTTYFLESGKKYTYDLKKLITSLRYLNIPYNKNFDDIMIAAYLSNYNLKDDITYLMNLSGEEATPVDALLKKNASLEEIELECVKKAKFIHSYYQKFLKELANSSKHLALYNDIEMPLVYVLSDMEYTGVRVDVEVLKKMKEEISIKMRNLEEDIYALAGKEFNIMSPKQLSKVLFEDLQIPYPKKIKDKSYSTSSDILNKLLDFPIVVCVLDYRMLSKLYSNYIVGLMDVVKDGKVHTTFNQTLTRTGRLSSNNPNLQNIPVREEYGKLIRKAFVASPNSLFVSSDYSQIELRIFAHMSDAANLIEAFKKGMDIHTQTAMDIYKVREDEVTPNMRRNAKAVNFGIIYGISSFGLSEDLGINVKDAKNFIDNYLKTYPGIKNYMDTLIRDAKEKGYVETLFGRTRVIDELSSSNYMVKMQGERMALNTPIQGTSADILKKAMIEIYAKFNELGLKSKMIIQVHDELLFDVLKEEYETVVSIVREIMENTYKLKVPLKVDINSGVNWYEAK